VSAKDAGTDIPKARLTNLKILEERVPEIAAGRGVGFIHCKITRPPASCALAKMTGIFGEIPIFREEE